MTKEQLYIEFEKHRGSLKSFILRISASQEDTEDIVQDTFLKAATKIDTFKGELTPSRRCL